MKQEILQKPWTPVEAWQVSKNELKVNVWGREYTFKDTVFPAQIKTAGQEILAAPIRLRAFYDGVEGTPKDTHYFDLKQDQGCCEFGVAQLIENTVMNARIRIEYDGLIRVKFCIFPIWNHTFDNTVGPDATGSGNGTYRLDRLFIDIPMKKEQSKLYHYFPNDGGSTIVLYKNSIPSGKLPKEGLNVPFKPYTWLGWEEGGLSLCCETDQNIELDDPNCALSYSHEDDCTLLRVHLLDHMPSSWQNTYETWGSAAIPVEFEYGLQATPVKPRPSSRLTEYQIFHMDRTSKEIGPLFKEFEESEEKGRELIRKIAENGAKYFLILGWTKIMNYWKPADPEKFKKFVDICHEYGLEPILYYGYEYGTIMEDWFDKGHEYLQKTADGRLTDGWLMEPPMPWHRAYTVCLNSSYADEFLNGIIECMETYGAKGVYLDGTFNFWECANEAHGCGYVGRDGKRHHTYPVYAVREFAKKLHYEVAKRGGILHVHQSGTCSVPTMAFSDVVLTGECVMHQMWNKEISLDMFRAEHSGLSTGINMQWISCQPAKRPEVDIEYIGAMPMLHGVMPMPRLTMDSLGFMSKVWKAQRDFEIDDARFIGYWQEECPVKCNTPGVYASVYEKAGALLAVVSNIGNEPTEFELVLPANSRVARSLLTEEDCKINCGKITLELGVNRIAMIEVQI